MVPMSRKPVHCMHTVTCCTLETEVKCIHAVVILSVTVSSAEVESALQKRSKGTGQHWSMIIVSLQSGAHGA